MKMKKILLLAMTALLAVSCETSDEYLTESPIQLLTGVESITRAPQLDDNGKGDFSQGDRLSLTVTNGEMHIRKDYAVGSTTLYWKDIDLEGESLTFAGCYPHYEGTGQTTFDFNAKEAADSDLLLAPAVTVQKGTATIRLPFRHAMHKLNVRYISDGSYTQDDLKGMETTVYAHTTCTVDLVRGTVTDQSFTAPEDYPAQQGATPSWLIVPQDSHGVQLKIAFQGKNCVFDLPAQTHEGQTITALESGKVLTVTLKVTKEGITLHTTDIGSWEEQGTIEGEIEL